MAPDSDGNVVLFGGSSEPIGAVSDTWSWDGSTWTEVSSGTGPSARFASGIATDKNGKVVLFSGGAVAGSVPNDTWLFGPPGDTTKPKIMVPDDINVPATSPAGAVVTYTVTATDDSGQDPLLNCMPPSASVFAGGTTTVDCTATDSSGNTETADFIVHVQSAPEQLSELGNAVKGVGPGRSLAAKVDAIAGYLAANDTAHACGTLNALINEITAQTGKKLSTSAAAPLISQVNGIKDALDC
jgi:hypothetical protein